MTSFLFLSLFATGLVAGQQICSQSLKENAKLCFNVQQVPKSDLDATPCSSVSCRPAECCRDPQTCDEANPFTHVQSICAAEFMAFLPTGQCAGTVCSTTRTCCQQFQSCLAIFQAGIRCPEASQIRDPTLQCASSACVRDDCCRAQTCGDYLANYEQDYCEARGLVDASSTKTCNGTCDGPQCCIRDGVPPTSCKILSSVQPDFCRPTQQLFNFASATFGTACPANECSVASCCTPPTTCGEFSSVTKFDICAQLDPRGLLLDQTPCSNEECKNVSKCCRVATSCADIVRLNPGFCGVGAKPNVSDFEIFFAACPENRCTQGRCCAPTQTCEEADRSQPFTAQIASLCRERQLGFNGQQPCTYGVDCNAATCCLPVATCRDVLAVDPSFAIRWCGREGQFFDSTFSCSGVCTASQCCRLPTSCFEYSQAFPQFCGTGVFVTVTETDPACANGKCDTRQCCRTARSCGESSITCGFMQSLDQGKLCFESCTPDICCVPARTCEDAGWNFKCRELGQASILDQSCEGSGCNATRCCKKIDTCQDFLSVNFKSCYSVGKIPNWFNSEPCNTQCTADRCCLPATTCGDANQLTLNRLCLNRGVVDPSVPCTGAGCTAEICCVRPQTCADVRLATSLSPTSETDTQWCSRDQFVDNFDFVICAGICTPAECCRNISTCDEWKAVFERNNPPSTDMPRTPVCRYGVFAGGFCNGPCDEKQCCRAPMTCKEAQVPCAAGEVLKPLEPCSDAGCNASTCCAQPITCDDIANDDVFCFAAGMVNLEPTTTPIICENGRCTADKCCRRARSCDEAHLTVFTCPESSYPTYNKLCDLAGCNVETCCERVVDCFTTVSINRDYCKGYGFINTAVAAFTPCVNNQCTQAQCCRPASICGEAAAVLCGGAVDYFKPCSGDECSSTSHCCRQPANCKEAIGYKTITCPAGTTPTNLNLATCPPGGCTIETCCRKTATCRDAAAAGSLSCEAPAILSPTTVCGSAPAPTCNATTCCQNAMTCKEAVASVTASGVPFCSKPLFIVNTQVLAVVCSPSCDQRKCCRAPFDCREAFLLDPKLCESSHQVFNFTAAHSQCENDDCVLSCCISPRTFAPSTAQPSRDSNPITAAPSDTKPTSARPTSDTKPSDSIAPTARPTSDTKPSDSTAPSARPTSDTKPSDSTAPSARPTSDTKPSDSTAPTAKLTERPTQRPSAEGDASVNSSPILEYSFSMLALLALVIF